ncbi:disease resistance protein At4g27190 [Medicago truncatula]|uniref:disease resistance protein At4g27190 n=1 Tax=Medicago truncatula TaxID=3880 RepID=UPI001967CDDC|nr:disease resistance protein At4g27190 [Medicago truncatula]
MECFMTELGKTLTEKVLNKAIEKSRNIFCFTCILKEFNEEKDKMEAGRATMREKFQVAANKGKGIKTNARLWEEQANKLIQENTKTNQRCFLGFCPDCIWRYKRGEDLSTKTKEIRKLMEEKFENVELDRHLPGVKRYSSQYYISFESRKLKYEELLDALRDDSNYITRLQGMGGTGKTTLAKEVGKQLKTSKQFNHVIDTTVSFTPDIKKIQDDIVGPLGLKWEDISESDRPKKLWSRLTNGEKILLILDNVWGNLNFDDIGIPKSDNHKGCKVLVTTRNLRVCNQMVCEKTIQLDLLNEEEAWSMFKLHANLTDNSSQGILKKGRKIATECKRLPVAIATVASSLKGQKRREEWDISLKTLQKPVSVGGIGDDLVDIYKCLKFSYDFLKDKNAEGLFLLCSTFPEDAEISTEVLTRLGIGVGLFGDDYGSYKDARTQAAASKNKLLDSCLLLETEEGYVKMHDLVREVAQLIANNEMNIVNFSNKNQKSQVERDKNIKYLICEGNLRDLFASKFDGSKLEFLIGNMHIKDIVHIPISFFENIPRLRVLNLSRHTPYQYHDYHHRLSLPQSIKPLSNIRSLSFEKFDLGDISAIGGLQGLETLELTHCAIDELPREIEKLENFRLLELKKCKIRNNNPFEVIQRCPSLEELYFLNSFNDSCKEITLPTLQRYRLNDVTVYHYKMKDTISRGVSLTWDYFSEATFKYVMETTELLHLEGTDKGWRNLMPGIVSIDNGMNDLIKLYLDNCDQVQCLVDTKHINSQVPSVFSNLKNVTLRSCSMLVSVFDLSTSRGLLLLEELIIFNCEKLESIITIECEEIVDGDNDNNKICNSMFPNLKVVIIDWCHQLQFVLPCYSARDFLLLEKITIYGCHKLKYIFGQHQDVQLPSLKELKLDDVPNFIYIFPEPSSIKGSSDSISKPQSELEPVKSNTFSWSQICCYGYKLKGSTSTKIVLVSEDQPKDCSITLESSSYILTYGNVLNVFQLQCYHISCAILKR